VKKLLQVTVLVLTVICHIVKMIIVVPLDVSAEKCCD